MKKIIILALSALFVMSCETFEQGFISMTVDGNTVSLTGLDNELTVELSEVVYDNNDAKNIVIEGGSLSSLNLSQISTDNPTNFVKDCGIVRKIANFETRSYLYQSTLTLLFEKNTVTTDFSFRREMPFLGNMETPAVFSYEPEIALVSIEQDSDAQNYAVYRFNVAVKQNGINVGEISFDRRFKVFTEALSFIIIDDSTNEKEHDIVLVF